MWQIIMLCLALCTDAFVASVCYGAGGIFIDWKRIGIMNGIGCLCLGSALCFGTAVSMLMSEQMSSGVCIASLFLLGILRLSDSLIKNYISRHCEMRRDIRFSFSGLRFILSIYADPVAADSDCNRMLSLRETVFLGFAMSIDSLAAGAFAAFLRMPVFLTLLVAFVSGCGAMGIGQSVGRRLARRLRRDISWVSGALFILLALGKMAAARPG